MSSTKLPIINQRYDRTNMAINDPNKEFLHKKNNVKKRKNIS